MSIVVVSNGTTCRTTLTFSGGGAVPTSVSVAGGFAIPVKLDNRYTVVSSVPNCTGCNGIFQNNISIPGSPLVFIVGTTCPTGLTIIHGNLPGIIPSSQVGV